jgi:hypothetical protein
VDAAQIRAAFDDMFDQALLFHGFAEHMRDHDLFIHATADPRTGIQPEHLRYRFTCCVHADVTTTVPPAIWTRSLDERLIDYEQGKDLDGYVWGVNWQLLYPGMKLIQDSAEAAQWASDLDIPFYEVSIEANGHHLRLIFSDLTVDTLEAGHYPFVIRPEGPDGKIPLP